MEAKKLFDELSGFIEENRRLLQKGEVLELAGFDGRVQELCQAVLQLSQNERVQYADKLQELFNSLTLLGEELVAQKDQVADEIRGVTQHKKAAVAYRIVEGSDKKEEE